MTPACLFAAVVLAVPSPVQVLDAYALVRHPGPPPAGLSWAAMVVVGTRLELIGPDELHFLPDECGVYGEPDAAALLALLQELHSQLLDAPPLADAGRLPPPAVCYEAAAFNGKVADHFRHRALWEPDREAVLTAAAVECDAYRDFWLTAGAGSGYGVAARRLNLAYVRDAVGRDNWAAGRLPDFVPAHLFHAR